MPRADAKLLARDDDVSREGGYRRWGFKLGTGPVVFVVAAETSSAPRPAPPASVCAVVFSLFSSVEAFFSKVVGVAGWSTENLISSESFW